MFSRRRKPKRNDQTPAETPNKPHLTTNRRPSQEEFTSTTPPRRQSIKGYRPPTNQPVPQGSPSGFDSSQNNGEQLILVDIEHLVAGAIQDPSQIAQAPTTTSHPSHTNASSQASLLTAASPPQTNAAQQPQVDSKHPATAQQSSHAAGSSSIVVSPLRQAQLDVGQSATAPQSFQVVETPPTAITFSSQTQTNTGHSVTAQRLSQVTDASPPAVASSSQINTGQQHQIRLDGSTTAEQPPQASEAPLIDTLLPQSETDVAPRSHGDTEHCVTAHEPSHGDEAPCGTDILQSRINKMHQSQADLLHPEMILESQPPKEPPAVVGIEELEMDDSVIAIMGPTGSGKSTFIGIASGLGNQGVGHTLRSFTSDVHAIRFWHEKSHRHVVMVDTPGFDDTFKSDLDILEMISDWLNSSYKKKEKLLSGILYLHRITDNRMAGTPLRNLRVFRKLCGKDALDKVWLTTTMWDEVDPSVGEQRLAELEKDYWKPMIDRGAHVARCSSGDSSSKQVVQDVLDHEAAHKVLLLQEEMTKFEKDLKETEAGQELYTQLEKLVERQMVLLRRINEERRRTSDPAVLTELQTEYDDLRTQIDERLRQIQELKLSRLKTLFRFFSRKRD